MIIYLIPPLSSTSMLLWLGLLIISISLSQRRFGYALLVVNSAIGSKEAAEPIFYFNMINTFKPNYLVDTNTINNYFSLSDKRNKCPVQIH